MVEEQSVFGPKPDESLEMDTLLYFRDMPVADRRKMQNAEFWNKVKMQVNISEKDQLVKMTLHLDFDELTDIDYFYDNLSNLEIQNGLSQNPFWPTSNSFELKKNKFSRLITLSAQNDLSGEELAFAKTFFADASYKCIYHLPGKVKKTTIPGATTDARTVVTTIPLLDLLNGTANLEGVIKFKKND